MAVENICRTHKALAKFTIINTGSLYEKRLLKTSSKVSFYYKDFTALHYRKSGRHPYVLKSPLILCIPDDGSRGLS